MIGRLHSFRPEPCSDASSPLSSEMNCSPWLARIQSPNLRFERSAEQRCCCSVPVALRAGAPSTAALGRQEVEGRWKHWLGLLGALIGAYLTAKYAEKNERRSQLRALADFLEGIAGCLDRMEKSLSNDVVPTADGHRLEEIVGEFAKVVQTRHSAVHGRRKLNC